MLLMFALVRGLWLWQVEALQVCHGGQVIGFCPGATPLFETIGAKANELAATRPTLTPMELGESLRVLLALEKHLPAAAPTYRVLRTGKQVDPPVISGRSAELPHHTIGRYAVSTEPGIEAIVLKPIRSEGGHTVRSSLKFVVAFHFCDVLEGFFSSGLSLQPNVAGNTRRWCGRRRQ
jgi:hypothetical protein